MAKTVSIRRSLLINIIVAIFLLGVAILSTSTLVFRQAAKRLSRSLITETLREAEIELEQLFGPVSDGLRMVARWRDLGMLDIDDPDALSRLLLPLLEQHPHVTTALFADERGREFMLLRDGDRWRVRQTRRDTWGDRTRWLEWHAGETPVESWRELPYDPRTRPWFQGALDAPAIPEHASDVAVAAPVIAWTAPYRFFTTGAAGITASIRADTAEGRIQVAGFDVEIKAISEFTASRRFGERGQMIVLTDDDRLIGLPHDALFDSVEERDAALLKRPDEINFPLAADARDAVRERDDNIAPLRFKSGGEHWWGLSRPYLLAPDRGLRIAVVVPESELLAGVRQLRFWTIGFTVLAIALAIARAIVLAARYGRPLEALAAQSNRISGLDLEEGPPVESTIGEVVDLADAHERMRVSLKSLLKLEQDLQVARQIQQQTFPAAFPRLRGYEMAAMTEPAEETGGDSYDVVGFRRHGEDGDLELTTGDADGAVFLLADATGHGVGPALSVSQLRSMLRMALRMGETQRRIIEFMNAQLRADLPEGRFITAWLGMLDLADETLRSFSAGQGPILLYRARDDTFEQVETQSPPMGVLDNLEGEEAITIKLEAGDILAVLSDGFSEAANPAAQLFGTRRLQEVISSVRRESPARIIEALQEAVHEFTQGAAAGDDQTVVIVKRTSRR